MIERVNRRVRTQIGTMDAKAIWREASETREASHSSILFILKPLIAFFKLSPIKIPVEDNLMLEIIYVGINIIKPPGGH
jgi:hypothetical protein